ncbi:MAG: LacI family transcriptional regulator [Lachnospiraceae bacterium]|jgi:LacI family transcriptional regulator|nr:LacI family transcriptional regulator [Lachnospiraceae bacterium]
MVTVKELARMCDVSPSTVSNILNGKPNVSEKTRQRVWQAVKETGYQPNYYAANMRKQSTRTISIIAEDLGQFSTTPILEAAMACCEEHEYRTVIMNLRLYDKWRDTWYYDERKLQSTLSPVLNEIRSIKVDGMLYVAGHGRVIKCFPEDFSLPTVIAYASAENDRFPSILLNDEKGGYDMIKYLTSMGHRRIGIIAGAADNMHTKERLLGCQRALFEEAIPYNPEWTVYGDWEKRSGYECAKKLAPQNLTAIYCMNDLMAGGVYDYAQEKGIVIGKDLSIVGYDNRQIAEYMYPGITTNELPLKDIGTAAANKLISMLSGEDQVLSHEPIRVDGKMIIRNSVARLK